MFERTRSFFRRLTGSADSGRAGEERRQWERFPTDRDVNVHIEGEPPLPGRIRDVSGGGALLLVDRLIERGTTIRIELCTPGSEAATAVLACIVHVRPAGEERFALGCSFSTELSDTDLVPLGARKVKPPVTEQRTWERRPATGQVLYSRIDGADESQEAGLHNISPTGVAVEIREEIAPGTLLNLDLRNSAGRSVLTIVACVVYLTGLGAGRWLAGCNFVRELYDEDLEALVAARP